MAPTLESGELLLVLRPPVVWLLTVFGGPESRALRRGAVVVLPQPRSEGRLFGLGRPLIVKRVVALEGEEVALLSGELLINGLVLVEPWLVGTSAGFSTIPGTKVPVAHVYLLGDNRQPLASGDSRQFGPQPVRSLRGEAVARLRSPFGTTGLRWPLAPL